MKAVRKLHHATGASSADNCKKTLGRNQIEDCPAVEKDSDLVQATFGPDISTLKGKTPRKTATADNRKAETSHKCSDKILRISDSGGCWVNVINCDNEF